MRRYMMWGGVAASVVLIVFGALTIGMGVSGTSTVNDSLKTQQITGTPDMNPSDIRMAVQKAGLKDVTIPSCTVANKAILSGSDARCFAQYMNIHALEATGGYLYSQMGMYVAKPGTPKAQLMADGATDNAQYAQIDPKTQQPVSNGVRNVWVTETALTTALNMSYMAGQLALFGIVVGIALLLAGVGFLVLALATLRPPKEPGAATAPVTVGGGTAVTA